MLDCLSTTFASIVRRAQYRVSAWAFIVCVLAPLAAVAQQNGTYAGILSNKDTISVIVGDNAFGRQAVTGIYIVPNKPIACTPGPTTLMSQIGVDGNFAITGDTATVSLYSSFEIIDASLTFVGNTVSGTVSAIHPAFTSYAQRPTTAVICKLPRHRFIATLVSDQPMSPASAP